MLASRAWQLLPKGHCATAESMRVAPPFHGGYALIDTLDQRTYSCGDRS